MRNRFAAMRERQGARVAWAGLFGLALCIVWAPRVAAQTYLCPPPPEGVYGLPGPPQFANPSAGDTFYSQLDDPRWNGSWREDFPSATTSTEAGARILSDGTYLYFSLQALADPDHAQPNADAVYLGFSQDGTTAIIVKIVMSGTPTDYVDSPNFSPATAWKTTDGGVSSWHTTGPQAWVAPTQNNIRVWTGAGTGNGAEWGFNARISLADVGMALSGSPLTGPFRMWYQIEVETGPGFSIPYAWPDGMTLTLDTASPGCTATPFCAVSAVSTWGIVNPTSTALCPTGISIDPMSIGTKDGMVGTIPGTTVHYGAGHPFNDFVAELTNSDPINPPTVKSVKGRFRIADWGAQIGMGGSWTDVATQGLGSSPPAVNGFNSVTAGEVLLECTNPPNTATSINCYQLPPGAPADQCLLVELSQGPSGSGVRFVHDSARRNMDFINASTFDRSATVSIKGLAPLATSTGTRDVYIYVKTQHMPAVTDGNHQAPVPPPVPPVTKGRDGKLVQIAPAEGASQGPPRYRMNTYERIASVTPTYEVHVYHDTGRTVTVGGTVRHVLEPQVPFGYFVEHAGDLSGWKHALVGEGFVLDEISPNFYHAKIPDNGSVRVHTTISSCQKHLFGLINKCGSSIAGCGGCQCSLGETGVPAAAPIFAVAATAIVLRRRRRRRG